MKTPTPWDLDSRWTCLSDDEKQLVTDHLSLTHFPKNAIIHHEGDRPTYAMLLVAGKIKITRMGNSCRPQILRLLRPYDTFAYRAIISGDTYNSTASAVEPVTALCIPADIFLSLLHSNIQFCFGILQLTASNLARAEKQTLDLTQKHIRGRLADALLDLVDIYGYEEDGETIAASVLREDLAAMSNMITANAIRTLSSFVADGIVTVNGRHITILDPSALRHLSLHD